MGMYFTEAGETFFDALANFFFCNPRNNPGNQQDGGDGIKQGGEEKIVSPAHIIGGPYVNSQYIPVKRGKHRRDKPAGKAHVVQVKPAVNFDRFGRDDREDKPDKKSEDDSQRYLDKRAVYPQKRDFADRRAEGRDQHCRKVIMRKGHFTVFGKQPYAECQRYHVEYIFAEKREADREPERHYIKPVRFNPDAQQHKHAG
jgi:hypothetical protein